MAFFRGLDPRVDDTIREDVSEVDFEVFLAFGGKSNGDGDQFPEFFKNRTLSEGGLC